MMETIIRSVILCHWYIFHGHYYKWRSVSPGHVFVPVIRQQRWFNPLNRFSLTCKTGRCSVNIEAALRGHRCVWSLQTCLNLQRSFAYRTECCCRSIFMKTLEGNEALLTPPDWKVAFKYWFIFRRFCYCLDPLFVCFCVLCGRKQTNQKAKHDHFSFMLHSKKFASWYILKISNYGDCTKHRTVCQMTTVFIVYTFSHTQ